MLKSVETERGEGKIHRRERRDLGKTGSSLSPSVQYVFINKLSWRTRKAPWEGELLALIDKLA